MEHSKDEDEKEQMRRAADMAFCQAYALCPYSPEALFRYCQLLVNRKRFDEAILIAKTSLRFDPESTQLKELISSLRKWE